MSPSSPGPIAVLGEALIDFVADGRDARLYHALAGGSGFNTSLGLARLDVPTAFCCVLSSDIQGRRLARDLACEGIDTSCILTSQLPCPVVLAQPGNAGGPPSYSLYLNGTALDEAPGAWALPPDTIHVHATSFASTTGSGGGAALATMASARGHASTSFDPNIRLAVLPDRARTRSLIAERIALSDIVKVSAEDLDLLAPGEDHDRLAASWLAEGPRLVVVTRGSAVATAFFGEQRVAASPPSARVLDTIGAGDSFMAALLSTLWEKGRLGPDFSVPPIDEMAGCLSFAALVAALTCTRVGADPPRRAELPGSA
ncbi:MAG: hypothetical protein JWL62_741 [Hyphomicrobiales bacterium]|nr:hypothetical protein [Hyphomicrobiales bacterium]